MDITAAAQTQESHEAAAKIVGFDSEDDIELAERYLITVSLSTHPSEYLLEDLLKRLRKPIVNAKLQETALMSLASITKSFYLLNGPKPVRSVL